MRHGNPVAVLEPVGGCWTGVDVWILTFDDHESVFP
jgi:hypothetical protein